MVSPTIVLSVEMTWIVKDRARFTPFRCHEKRHNLRVMQILMGSLLRRWAVPRGIDEFRCQRHGSETRRLSPFQVGGVVDIQTRRCRGERSNERRTRLPILVVFFSSRAVGFVKSNGRQEVAALPSPRSSPGRDGVDCVRTGHPIPLASHQPPLPPPPPGGQAREARGRALGRGA